MGNKEDMMAEATLPSQRIDFVLATALAEERDSVLDKLPGYWR